MVAVRGRPLGLPVCLVPVRQPAYSYHPLFGDTEWWFTSIQGITHERIHGFNQQRRRPPLAVRQHHTTSALTLSTASYRIRAVTQLLENLAMRGDLTSDTVVLSDFALLCCVPLRDGCDVLDVIARRMDAEPA